MASVSRLKSRGKILTQQKREEHNLTTEEIWKEHPQHKGFEFSSLGRHRNMKTGRVLTPSVADSGSVTAEVKPGGKRVRNSLGRLILESFIGPAPKGLKLTHRDGNPGNNLLENIYWGAGTKYNLKHRKCEIPGCEERHQARGFCPTHWREWRKENGPRCRIDYCDYPAPEGGLCSSHNRRRRAGIPLEAPMKSRGPLIPEGEWSPWYEYPGDYVYRYKTVDGIRINQAQHRFVMEEHIGRPLRREETVHHINGVRHDNRLENLELWSSSHPSGQRIDDKVSWAVDLLKLYRPEVLKEGL